MKIQWTNKWSGEKGFVKEIHNKEKYFENTFDKMEAKMFSPRLVKKVVANLEQFCPDNTYEIGLFEEKGEEKKER